MGNIRVVGVISQIINTINICYVIHKPFGLGLEVKFTALASVSKVRSWSLP